MKGKQKINVIILGKDDPSVMENVFKGLAGFMTSEIEKKINGLNITYEEKKKIAEKVFLEKL